MLEQFFPDALSDSIYDIDFKNSITWDIVEFYLILITH